MDIGILLLLFDLPGTSNNLYHALIISFLTLKIALSQIQTICSKINALLIHILKVPLQIVQLFYAESAFREMHSQFSLNVQLALFNSQTSNSFFF